MNRDDAPDSRPKEPEHPSDAPFRPDARTKQNTDRNLLFGIVAVQMSFITRDGLVSAMRNWVLGKERSLGEILVDLGAMHLDHRKMLDPLVAAFLQQYDNDLRRCLDALSSVTSIKADLDQLCDPDLTVSLRKVEGAQESEFLASAQEAGSSRSSGGRFQIIRPHAKGGLGQVSVALDKELNREVALKEIQEKHLQDQASRERFVLEAEITGGLQHPGIVPVYGLGQFPDGSPFYAMRFIRGDSLKAAIQEHHGRSAGPRSSPRDGRLEMRKLLGRFIDVCNAMEYAHSRGVLHRDLKPGNIMLGKYGETLVVDWGLAKTLGRKEFESEEPTLIPSSSFSSSGQTVPGSVLGTPAYMSPEQAEGKLDELGPETDVYSLGATLYHLLTGRAAFQGEPREVVKQVRVGDFVHPRMLAPDIAPALEAICLKAMSLEPRQRYSTPRAMADDVERWLADEPVAAHAETWPERLSRLERKHRTLVRAGTVSSAVIAALAVVAALWINVERNKSDRLAVAEAKARINARNAQKDAERAKIVAEQQSSRADSNAKAATQRSRELQIQLAKSYFLHGQSEYENGRAENAAKDFAIAWHMLPADDVLRVSFEQVLIDRLVAGGRQVPFSGGYGLSSDRSMTVSAAEESGRYLRRIRRFDSCLPVGPPFEGRFASSFQFVLDDKKLIGAKTEDGTIGLWDVKTAQPAGELTGHTAQIYGIAVSPDGYRAASWSKDNTLRLWDLRDFSLLAKPIQHQEPIRFVAFAPDGKRFFTATTFSLGSFDKHRSTIQLWDGGAGTPIGDALRQRAALLSVKFSPDGSILAAQYSGNERGIRIWDGTNGQKLKSALSDMFQSDGIAFKPDGRQLLTFKQNQVQFWDAQTGVQAKETISSPDPIRDAGYSPDGSRIFAATERGVLLWDSKTKAAAGDPMTYSSSSVMGNFFPDGTRLYSQTRLWDAFPNLPVGEFTVPGTWLTDVAFDADGSKIFVAIDNTICAWDAVTLSPLGEILREEKSIRCFALSRDGTRLAVATEGRTYAVPAYARVWDPKVRRPVGAPMAHSGAVLDVAIRPDGSRIATGGADGFVRLWDGGTGALIGQLKDAEGQSPSIACNAVAFSPDGKYVAATRTGSTAGLWDADSLAQRKYFDSTSERIVVADSLSYSPDGTRLATRAGNAAHLWDVRSAQKLGETMRKRGGGSFASVAFSPDGKSLVAGAAVGGDAVQLWDAWTGVPLRERFEHEGVRCAAFSPDGRRLITANRGGVRTRKVLLWDIEPLPAPRDLPKWIRSMTGVNVEDESGNMPPMDPPRLDANAIIEGEPEWYMKMRRRQDQRSRLYQEFAARRAEAAKDWFVAEFHLRHLLQAEPENSELKTRLQTARDRLKN